MGSQGRQHCLRVGGGGTVKERPVRPGVVKARGRRAAPGRRSCRIAAGTGAGGGEWAGLAGPGGVADDRGPI